MPNELKIIIDADVSRAESKVVNFGKTFTDQFTKINNSANALSSSITTSIQKINNSLSSLKVTSVDITVDTSSIDASVKSIQSKLSALTNPEINVLADTSLAEAKIKELLTDLSTLKGSEIFISANDVQALKVINDVEAELNSLLDKQIRLNVDSTEANRKIGLLESELSSIKSLVIQPGANFGLVESSIKKINAELESLRSVNIKADPTQAISSIDKILTEINQIKDKKILLGADNTAALNSVNQLESQLKDIKANVVINAQGFDAANAAIKNTKANLYSLSSKGIKVDVDATAALTKIGILEKELAGLQKLSISPNISSTQFELFNKNIDQVKAKINELRGKDVGTFVFKANAAPAIKEISSLQAKVISLDRSLKSTSGLNTFQSSLAKSTASISALQNKATGLTSFYGSLSNATKQAAGGFDELGKKSAAAGAATSNAFSKAFSGLKTFANIIPGLGISTLFGVIISAVTALGEALIKTSNKAKVLRDATGEAIGSSAGEIFKINAAVATLKDQTATINAQTNARKFLNEEVGINLSLLSKEKIGSEQTAAAIDKLTESIFQKALAEAFAAKFAAKQVELFEKQQKLNAALANLPTNFADFLTIGANLGNTATAAGILNKEIENIKLELVDIKKFGQDAFKKAFDVPPKAKTLSQLNDDLKKQEEAILARARAFVKEFGDAFVLPNLEESFFTKKGDLVKVAGNLLDNVKKEIQQKASILQIKLPVDTHLVSVKKTEEILDEVTGQFKTVTKVVEVRVPILTELDFIPPDTTQFAPLSKELIDDLTKRFFEDIKPIEANIIFDPTLTVDQIKLRNQQADLRKQFEDTFGNLGVKVFAKINFDNLTEGIAKATEQFANMKLVLDTLTASVSEGLSSAFNNVFDAILEGKNVFKALGESVKALVVDTIKAIAKMFILKAVTAALGGGGVVSGLGGLIGGFGRGGGVANFGLGGAIGNRAFNNVIQITGGTRISGQDIIVSYNRATNSNQRGG